MSARALRRRAAVAAYVAAAMTVLGVASPSTAAADREPDVTLADVARANSRYHSIGLAERSGYSGDVVPDCMDHPDRGGMGVHWIDVDLLTDGEITPLRPEALVYELDGRGKQRLVAVEWVMPPSDDFPAQTAGGIGPVLFDQEFTWHADLEVWKLHAWLFRPNPDGVFADFNPWANMCPTAATVQRAASRPASL